MANLKKLKKSIILFNAIISEQLTFALPTQSSHQVYTGTLVLFFSFFFIFLPGPVASIWM